MAEIRRKLPKRAWLRVYRIAGALIGLSIMLSLILTNVIMETFSAGINVQGLVVSIAMPLTLGGPLIFLLMLKHERLRYANSQLEHLAATDWLTTCLNRGAFTGAVIRHLDRLASAHAQGALLIVDADDFKSVNDRFGHDHGDRALQLMASAIRQAVSGNDLVGRLGGEEFGVLLVGVDSATADDVAERIRSAIATITFAPNGTKYPLSVSIGGAIYVAGAQFNDLYRLADQRLYAAKHAGRDRVAIAQAA
ncbi:GGDEF domain-containing protein [Devosia sp. A449]